MSSPIELSQEQLNTAIKSPEHLRQWLEQSGRTWLVFNGVDLIEALPFPAGHEILIQLISVYRDHRAVQESSRYRVEASPSGETLRTPLMKEETLEIEELDRAIRYLIGQASSLDPKWSLDNPAL